jgi:O-antigen/teichoic acid export membrane protein
MMIESGVQRVTSKTLLAPAIDQGSNWQSSMAFIKSVSITLLTRIFTLMIGIATSIIIARALGPKGQGIYSLVMLLPITIVSFFNLGIGRSSTYYIGIDTYSLRKLIGTILTFSLIINTVSIIVAFVTVLYFGNSILPGIPQGFLLLSLLLIPLQLFFLHSFSGILLGFQKFKEYNLILVAQSASLFFLAVLFLIKLDTGIIGAINANLLSLLLSNIMACFCIFKSPNKISFSLRLDKTILSALINFGYKVQLNTVLAFLHLRIDTFLLNLFLNPVAVGFYVISVGIAERLWIFSQAISTVLYPRIASMKSENQKNLFTAIIARYTFFISILGAILIFFLSNWLIQLLYSDSYLPAVEPLQILLIGVIAISVERILANDILARGKPMINTRITFLALVANIILNIFLIPRYGIIGAAWATSISYSTNTMIKLIIFSRITGLKISETIIIRPNDISNLYKKLGSVFIISS